MNPACPQCQTELEDDFGIVDCKSCGAICSIDLEDNVTVQGDLESPEPVEETIEEEVLEETVEEPEEVEALEDLAYEEPLVEEEVLETATEEAPLEEEEPEDPTENIEEETYESEDLEAEVPFEEPALVPEPTAAVDFLKDLEVFSEESSSEGLGHIYYDFHVRGFESSQQKEIFIETLADSRLELSEDFVRELLGEKSEFVLPQVSFLRLVVIYKRLLSMDLEMSWTLSEVQEAGSTVSEDSESDYEYAETEEEY